jgi:NTE family protein
MGDNTSKIGLVLTGGGARGAYQAGAIRAIAEITKEIGIDQPFNVLVGASAGSINVSYLACRADRMFSATAELQQLWEEISTDKIFRVDTLSLLRIAARWAIELTTGALSGNKTARALLDTTPLRNLITDHFDLVKLNENINEGLLHALAITAVSYGNGSSKTFFQGPPDITAWARIRRASESALITPDHIMASTAIPLLFPPVQIGNVFYGDGSLRNHAPLSPAINLGADKVLAIAVRREEDEAEGFSPAPTIGRIASVLLNSIFLDAVDIDYERMTRVNRTLAAVNDLEDVSLRPVDVCIIRPSRDIAQIAVEEVKAMPATLRHLVRGLGTPEQTAGLLSYLLFEPPFTRRLTSLGYQDAWTQKEQIVQFYKGTE